MASSLATYATFENMNDERIFSDHRVISELVIIIFMDAFFLFLEEFQ